MSREFWEFFFSSHYPQGGRVTLTLRNGKRVTGRITRQTSTTLVLKKRTDKIVAVDLRAISGYQLLNLKGEK